MGFASRDNRISPLAYIALREALSSVVWYKERSLRPFLQAALRDHPEVLAGIDFKGPSKREIVGAVVDRLTAGEAKYRSTTIYLMLDVADMIHFPDFDNLEDREEKVSRARKAVAVLKAQTEKFDQILDTQKRLATERAMAEQRRAAEQHFRSSLSRMRAAFWELHKIANPQVRGKTFEMFLHDLFNLYELKPELAYELDTEQIDGFFSFDGDDYIVEAKWTKQRTDRAQADTFAKKVERRAKNALGLFVSMNGFTSDAISTYKYSTPFITMEGPDIVSILDGHMGLDDMLTRKRRYANKTGQCYHPYADMID